MAIYRLGDHAPRIPQSAYVAPEAVVIGRVTLGERVCVLPCAVIRADNDEIVIGDNSNVQDGAVLHVDPGIPMAIGANVTIGHQAMLHGCTIGDGTLVGIQAVVLNKATIGRDCLVAAGAVVLEGKVFPERSLIVGAPARVHRPLTDADVASLKSAVEAYVQCGKLFKAGLERIA
jgi:carbonic anhydrase/acetyltransferase-like protein (isoleucine patch superfamily)